MKHMSIYQLLGKIPNHIWVAVSNWCSRIIIAMVQLVSIRMLLAGFGSEKFAVFVLLTSLIGWYSLSDMGVGLSLQNYISEKRSLNEPYTDYLSSAFVITLVLWCLGIFFLFLISPVIAPIFLKQFTFISDAEKIKYFFIIGFIYFSVTLSSTTYKIWYAEQKGYLANIVPAIASLIGLFGVWYVLKLDVENKLLIALIAFTSPAMILGVFFFFLKTIVFSKLRLHKDIFVFKNLVNRAGRFFFFALIGLFITQIDYFVLSQTVKSYDIVIYNISNKLFSFAFSIYVAVLTAWHPVNAEMYVRNEFFNIRRYAKTYIIAGILGIILFTFGFMIFKQKIIMILSPQENIIIPVVFILLLGIYFAIRIWNDTFVTLLVSMNKFRHIFIIAPIQIVISALLQITLAYKFGINGLIVGLIIAYLSTSAWFLPKVFKKHVLMD